MKLEPEYIILHHSATRDCGYMDAKAIRRFHTSWSVGGNVIPEGEARRLIADGVRVRSPWVDVGYHFLIEQVDDEVEAIVGRMLDRVGAHCNVGGMNALSIGICVIGNYNAEEVPTLVYYKTLNLVAALRHVFAIPLEKVLGHCEVKGTATDCPGKRFDMTAFRGELMLLA